MGGNDAGERLIARGETCFLIRQRKGNLVASRSAARDADETLVAVYRPKLVPLGAAHIRFGSSLIVTGRPAYLMRNDRTGKLECCSRPKPYPGWSRIATYRPKPWVPAEVAAAAVRAFTRAAS